MRLAELSRQLTRNDHLSAASNIFNALNEVVDEDTDDSPDLDGTVSATALPTSSEPPRVHPQSGPADLSVERGGNEARLSPTRDSARRQSLIHANTSIPFQLNVGDSGSQNHSSVSGKSLHRNSIADGARIESSEHLECTALSSQCPHSDIHHHSIQQANIPTTSPALLEL